MLKHTCSLLGHRPPTVSYPRHPSWKKNFRRRAKKDLFSSFWQGFRRTYYYFFLPIFYQSKKNVKFKLYKSIPFAWNREETEITPTPCEIHRLPYEKLSFSVIFSHEKPKLSSLTAPSIHSLVEILVMSRQLSSKVVSGMTRRTWFIWIDWGLPFFITSIQKPYGCNIQLVTSASNFFERSVRLFPPLKVPQRTADVVHHISPTSSL